LVRLAPALFVASAVAAGCGGGGPVARDAPGRTAPAPDQQRVQDLVPLSTAQVAQRAQRIALVVSRGSRVVEGAPGTPFTRTTFAVQDVLKGRLGHRIVLQVIGGRLGNVVVPSPVQAFAASSRYILFLGPDGRAGPTIFPQAIFEVRRTGGADVVAPAPRGIRLLAAGSAKPAGAFGGAPRLDDVLFSLRRYLGAKP
jgi:hypothetical protein